MTDSICPACGAELPAEAKFCPSCGAAIGRPTDERRIVTVLFGDVVGFTPYSEDRDPEHVKNVLDRCFERVAADVTSHGGRIDKIVGDELMAVFGAPVAHEDDPERAVRAALQIHRTLAEHSQETGSVVRMRIGVNTGEVLVGALRGGGDVTALGDVVNTANRLQTLARPGEVLVGPATQSGTKDVISYEPVGTLAVKGREAGVEAWRALEPFGPPGFRPRGTRRQLVGRKAELGMLWHALSTSVAYRRPHLVLIVGEAGVGKTLLVEESLELARTECDALVLQGRCLPYGEANPWWPVAEALRQACGIDATDPADTAVSKCREAVASVIGVEGEGSEASRVADGLLYLMGYEATLHEVDPSRAREEALRSIRMSLAANARNRPTVVVLSEIHWADQVVLDLIDVIFERLRDLPIVVFATARPELMERWTPKPGRHNLLVLHLDALGREDAERMARSLLPEGAGDDLVRAIVERSGGNPLFIDELAKLLGEAAAGVNVAALELGELPGTLRGLVSARLDSLDAGERSALEDAAVVGRSGPVEALAALADARGDGEGRARLTALAERDLLVIDGEDYEFRSELVREVAYETLTKAERARRHAGVASWLASYARRTEREEEYLERIAHHFAQASGLVAEVGGVDDVPNDVLDRALDYLDRAASRAEERETIGVSLLHLLEHALELLGEERPVQRARFLLSRARGRCAARDMAGAHADVDSVLEVGMLTGDEVLRARALTVRGEIQQRERALEESAVTLQEAAEAWKRVGDRRGEGEALRLWGFTSLHRGQVDAAEDAISRALEISRELGDRRGEAWALQNLAWTAFTRGDLDVAEERLLASSNLFEEIGDFGGQGWATGLLGYVWYFKGHLDRAGVVAEGTFRWTRETGDRWGHGMMLNLLSSVRLWQGRTREALDLSSEAYGLFEEIDDDMGLALTSMVRAWALILLGRRDEALDSIDANVGRADKVYVAGGTGRMAAAMLRALVGKGDEALAILDDMGVGEDAEDIDMLVARSLALLVAGQTGDAYVCASRAWSLSPADVGSRANTACLLALSAATVGRAQEAVDMGTEVGRIGGTYLDQTRAHLARAFGYASLGAKVESRSAVGSARRIVDASEDAVTKALVSLAEAVLDGGGDENGGLEGARVALEALNVEWEAWERLYRVASADAGESRRIPARPG